MNYCKKYFSIFITAAIFVSMLGVFPVFAEEQPRYILSGTDSTEEFNLDISIENIAALAGRIAVTFDPEKLELADTTNLTKAIMKSSDVTISSEGHDASVLLSNAKGYAMFAWYPTKNAALNAQSGSKHIASIPFRLKSGYTTADFTRNTFGIRYVNTSMIDQWTCGAEMVASGLDKYTNISGDDMYLCKVSYDYPNCDYTPIVTYDAHISVTDLYGNAINGAIVTVDDLEETTDLNGEVSFHMENGVYGYRVTADGYQIQTGYITVDGNDAQSIVMLKSHEQMVQTAANDLNILFASGDDAGNVTQGVGLLESGVNGESISWESSNPAVITTQGIVNRQKSDVNVTLTATISVGRAVAKREFYVTVKGKETAQEINAAIVKMDAQELTVLYAPGDSEQNVTADMTLTELGAYGSYIIWESDRPDIIDRYGAVTRPMTDTRVTLTADVMRGGVSEKKVFTVTVKAQNDAASDDDIVNKVLAELSIGYSDGDSAESVTNRITLPMSGAENTIIVWTSSSPDVVTGYGGVVRQAKDSHVTLTATVYKGEKSEEKQFNIVVKAAEVTPDNPDNDMEEQEQSDVKCVALDKENVKIIYAPGDSEKGVTANLTLPLQGDNGSRIFWESNDSGIINSYGTVTRPDADTDVTLTAIISKGAAADSVTFKVNVKGRNIVYSDNENNTVKTITNALEVLYQNGDSADSVTKSVTLPTVGAYGASITWKSSNTDVIGTNGTVTRKSQDESVILTATVFLGGVTEEKRFKVIVLAAEKPSGVSVINGSQTQQERFNDISIVPWAREAILTLAEQGIINGTGERTFSPQNPIRRADFITLLVKLLDLKGEITDSFSDVTDDKYYYETVSLAKSRGIISGVGDNKFKPEGNISRQDMMVMTTNALERLGMAEFKEADLSKFSDKNDVSDYAYNSVSRLVGAGLISGNNGKINPKNNTTRAETAVFLYGLYSEIER